MGLTEPFTSLGLGPSSVPDLDQSAQPGLDEVLAIRNRQGLEMDSWLGQVTPEQLQQTAPVPDDDRWPSYATGPTRKCLGTVLNEEFEHHGFCVRDLNKLAIQNVPDETK